MSEQGLRRPPECCNYIVDVCGFFRLLLRNTNKAKYTHVKHLGYNDFLCMVNEQIVYKLQHVVGLSRHLEHRSVELLGYAQLTAQPRPVHHQNKVTH